MEDIGSECGCDGGISGTPDVVETGVAMALMAKAAWPVRMRLWSSRSVTSLTQDNRLSIAQRSRHRANNSSAVEDSVERMVIAKATVVMVSPLTVVSRSSFKKLTHAWPVTRVGSDRRGRQRATFNTPTTLLDRGRRPPYCTRLAFGVEGEKPSGITKA